MTSIRRISGQLKLAHIPEDRMTSGCAGTSCLFRKTCFPISTKIQLIPVDCF